MQTHSVPCASGMGICLASYAKVGLHEICAPDRRYSRRRAAVCRAGARAKPCGTYGDAGCSGQLRDLCRRARCRVRPTPRRLPGADGVGRGTRDAGEPAPGCPVLARSRPTDGPDDPGRCLGSRRGRRRGRLPPQGAWRTRYRRAARRRLLPGDACSAADADARLPCSRCRVARFRRAAEPPHLRQYAWDHAAILGRAEPLARGDGDARPAAAPPFSPTPTGSTASRSLFCTPSAPVWSLHRPTGPRGHT